MYTHRKAQHNINHSFGAVALFAAQTVPIFVCFAIQHGLRDSNLRPGDQFVHFETAFVVDLDGKRRDTGWQLAVDDTVPSWCFTTIRIRLRLVHKVADAHTNIWIHSRKAIISN